MRRQKFLRLVSAPMIVLSFLRAKFRVFYKSNRIECDLIEDEIDFLTEFALDLSTLGIAIGFLVTKYQLRNKLRHNCNLITMLFGGLQKKKKITYLSNGCAQL